MRETRKIAILIVKRYKMEYTLTTSEARALDNWKSRSAENVDILNKLIEIYNEKVVLPFSPPPEISVLILKHYSKNFECLPPLTEEELDTLNEWRKESPQHEEWFNRMNPAEASVSIEPPTEKQVRQWKRMALRAWILRPFRILLFSLGMPRKKKPIPKEAVVLVEQVLESRKPMKNRYLMNRGYTENN